MNNTVKKEVIIVGAGISGLTCARELSQYTDQINLTVLEGSNRIGGRVRSHVADDGTILELGAHFIHGTKDNPIFDFAAEKKIIKPDVTKEWQPYKILHCFHKSLLKVCSIETREQAVNIGVNFRNQVFDSLFTMPEDEVLKNYKSIGDYVNQKFKILVDTIESDDNLQDAIKSVLISTINDENATSGCKSLSDLDIEGFLDYIDLDGDLQYILHENGYSEIVHAIANDIRTDCIKFKEEVNKIENLKIKGSSKMRITCTNGNVYIADSVILTMSVEVLKMFDRTNKFGSLLPTHKIKSLNRLCLGQVAKVYFKFTEPLDLAYRFIRFYPSTDNFGCDVFKKYSQIISFDRIKDSDWWLIWLVGDLVDELESNDPVNFMTNLLSECKKDYPEFPDLKLDADSVTVSDWTVNHLYGGAYSYLKVGSSDKDILNLAEPILFDEASLLFAGEMTDTQFYSTTHGAFQSGIREAERLKSMYKITLNNKE